MSTVSHAIKKLFEQDQADRRSATYGRLPDIKRLKILQQRDRGRIRRLEKILKESPELSGVDCFRAGIIFQHGGNVKYTSRARKLAQQGIKKGHEKSKWLYAAATDRVLVMQHKKQKFGTQYQKDAQGSWKLLPVDPKTTDTERKKFSVKSLQEAKNMVLYLNRAKRPRSKKLGIARR